MIDEAVPTHIMTDAEQLTHILRHLLDNALKFTEHGQMLFKVDIKMTILRILRFSFGEGFRTGHIRCTSGKPV